MATSEAVKLSRRQLYDEVWATPMMQLCKKYGLSDVGMAKLCKKHDIPRPPRGYWAQKQVGRAPAQTPLPSTEHDCQIVLHESRVPTTALQADADSKVAMEQQPEQRIEVPDTLRGAHELVHKAFEELQVTPTGSDGFIVAGDATLAVHVSKSSLRRALRIIDALLKALEQRGYQVSAGPAVSIFDIWIKFDISEQPEVKEEPADDEDLDGRYTFRHNRFNRKVIPSGRLTLRIEDPERYRSAGRRKTWRDGSKQKLENVLNKFVAGLIAIAANAKHADEERQRQAEARRAEQLRREEEARLLAEKRALIKAERDRVEALLQQAKNWRQSEDLRAFVERVRQTHLAARGEILEESDIGRWVTWALQQVDRLDPLRESPPSILDEKIPDEAEIQRTYRGW